MVALYRGTLLSHLLGRIYVLFINMCAIDQDRDLLMSVACQALEKNIEDVEHVGNIFVSTALRPVCVYFACKRGSEQCSNFGVLTMGCALIDRVTLPPALVCKLFTLNFAGDATGLQHHD